MSDLKPCPFCGSEAVIKKYFIKGVANHLNYFVACKCEIRTRSRKNIDGATSDWNSRPIEDALRVENERLEQRIRELEEAQSTLTEQLRLANEDAERLAEYVGHKRTCTWAVVRSDVTPRCDCGLSDALHLHEERIAQKR